MNNLTEDMLKLLDYIKRKQNINKIDAKYYVNNRLDFTMNYIKKSKTILIPEIIIWDDKYTNSPNEYIYSFDINAIIVERIKDNFLQWENPKDSGFSRYLCANNIVLRYKDDFIIMDYGAYVIDVVLIPKNYITDLPKRDNSIIDITEEQYSSFRSFINDLKNTMKERQIPPQLITEVNDENIDLILDDISSNLSIFERTCTNNSISLIVISNYERCTFKFESENKEYITAIKLITEI